MLKYKVLIVDDVEITQKFYVKFLENRAEISELVCVKDAFDAWYRLCVDRNIRVLIIDIDLGGVSGRQLLEKVLKEDFRKDFYIIISSTNVDESDRLVSLGADHSLPKPLSREAMESAFLMAQNQLDPSSRFFRP
jgi:CheY-like chemotaxis protein